MPDTNKCWLKEPLLLAIRIFCFLSVALHISLKNIAGDNSPTLTLCMLNTWDSSLASYRVGSEISSAAAGLVSRTLGGRTQYKQLPEPNMPVSTLISQAMGSRCFFSLGLALILPSAPAAFPESPSDELPWDSCYPCQSVHLHPWCGIFYSPNRKDHLNMKHCPLPDSEDEAAYQSG